jgi:hypothetical protein
MKPKTVQNNLFLARWVYPEFSWKVNCGGGVQCDPPNGERKYFSLSNPRDREKVEIKLFIHGWTIKQVKRDHKDVWRASKGGSSIEKPVLDGLLVGVVKRIEREGK